MWMLRQPRSAAFVAVVEILQPVQVVQVPEDRGVLAVDLERVERLVAAGVARRLEGGQRAVVEARQERAGVVDADLLDLAGQIVLALLDEGFGHGGDFVDAAVEPHGGVDAVRQQVAGDAAAGDADVEPPQALAALRQVAARSSSPAGTWRGSGRSCRAGPRRSAAWPASRRARGGSCTRPCWQRRPSRRPSTIASASAALRPSGFSHITILPGLRGGDGDLGVGVVGAGDVDQVDVLALDQLAPVGLDRFVAPVIGESLGRVGVARADRLQHRLVAAGRRNAATCAKALEWVRPMKP